MSIDQEIAKVVDEAYKAFADGQSRFANPYKSTYWKINDECIGDVWDQAYCHARDKAQSNAGKVLGHVDLSKFKKNDRKEVHKRREQTRDRNYDSLVAGGDWSQRQEASVRVQEEGSCYDEDEIRDADYYKRFGLD